MNKQIPLLLFLIVCSQINIACRDNSVLTEWTQLPAPLSARITSFVETSDGTYFAGASELYKSEDQGQSWEMIDFNNFPMGIMETDKGSLLVGTYRGGMFRSVDGGESWANVGFEKNVYIFKIIQTADGKIFASVAYASDDSQSGVFVSEDDGLTWQLSAITAQNIKGVFNPTPELIFASGTGSNNFHRSQDVGDTWSTEINGLPDSIPVSAMIELDGRLFASLGDPQDAARRAGGGIYMSEDGGLNWVRSDNGISDITKVNDLELVDNTIYASTGFHEKIGERGVFKSVDLGQTWQPAGLNDLLIRFISKTTNGQLVVGSNSSSIFTSEDDASTWLQSGKEIKEWGTFQIVENNDYLFANSESGVWRADLDGGEWKNIKDELGSLVKLSNGNLLLTSNGQILRTENNGETWEAISELKSQMIFPNELDPHLLVACVAGGIFYSTDHGQSWQSYDLGEFGQANFRASMRTSKGTILVGSTNGTLRSTDMGKTWTMVDEAYDVWTFAETENAIYAGGFAQGVHRSTDDGQSWTEFNSGLREGNDYLTATSLCTTSEGSVICGTLGEGIYKLQAGDSIWRDYSNGLTNHENFGIILGTDGNLYTTSSKGIFRKKE